MRVTPGPGRLDFDDYVRHTEAYPDGAFELVDGGIFSLAPESDSHLLTRSGINLYLYQTLDLTRYTPRTEASFPAPGWADGPRPDNFVSRGPWLVDGKFSKRPAARDIALVIEVSSTTRPKDKRRSALYARLAIPEFWLVDLLRAAAIVHRDPAGEGDNAAYRSARPHRRGETIAASAVDGLTVEADFLLQLARDGSTPA